MNDDRCGTCEFRNCICETGSSMKVNEVKNNYDEDIERIEAELEFAQRKLNDAKRQKARADELWQTVKHLSAEDLEILYNVIKYQIGREYIDK